jgi:hypothetical protein
MAGASERIVQYVGFATAVGREEFLERWMPFARQFSDRGARTIDLYEVSAPAPVRYISRNVWDAGIYLGSFPDGVAAGGGGGGVKVEQFGGYWMEPGDGEAADSMRVAFLPSPGESPWMTARMRCADKVPYLQVLDLLPFQQPVLPAGSILLTCIRVKSVS